MRIAIMVRTWNREPSPDQMKARRSSYVLGHTPAIFFHPNNPRFAYDGKIKMPNFLNGLDGQLAEARGHMSPADTATHTRYDFSSTGVGNLSISLAAEVAKSINTCATMRSSRPKSATSRSLVANDTRYSHLQEPHREHVGPGSYDIERAVPSVGQMPPDSHTCSATPQRDPYRASAPFMAPERPERPPSAFWPRPGGPDAVYISPEFVPAPDRAPSWDVSIDKRPDAADWRHSHARVIAAVVAGAGTGGGAGAGSAAAEAPFASDLPTDIAGRPLELALRASLRNPHMASFASREPRLTVLPPERTSDLRASRLAALRGPNDTAHLGPGAYSPPTSVGGPRRRTYRIYVDPLVLPHPSDCFGGTGSGGGGGGARGGRGRGGESAQAEAAAVVAAYEHRTARAAAAARAAAGLSSLGSASGGGGGGGRSLSARSRGSSCGSLVSSPRSFGGGGGSSGTTRLGPSSAFSGTFRDHKSGAFDWRTDSRLVKY